MTKAKLVSLLHTLLSEDKIQEAKNFLRSVKPTEVAKTRPRRLKKRDRSLLNRAYRNTQRARDVVPAAPTGAAAVTIPEEPKKASPKPRIRKKASVTPVE